MKNVAKDDYYPSLRVNAVLVIGEVNTPEAISELLDLVGPAGQMDYIRVAAMSGLMHLAEPCPRNSPPSCLLTPAVANPVIAKMVKIVRAPIPKTLRRCHTLDARAGRGYSRQLEKHWH